MNHLLLQRDFSKAANKEYVSALYRMAQCYQHGIGVERSDYTAVKNYKRASVLGHTNAMFYLAAD